MYLSVKQRPAAEIIDGLPDLVPVGEAVATDADLILSFLGFEDRVVALPRAIAREHSAVPVVVFQYRTNREGNDARLSELVGAWEALGFRYEFVPLTSRRAFLLSRIAEMRHALRRPIRVLVDLSVASNVALASLLPLLIREQDMNITLFYGEAEVYAPVDRRAVSGGATEQGVRSVEVVAERPGYRVDSLGDAVVIVAGFGPARARAAVAELFPSKIGIPEGAVEWVFGLPPAADRAWRASYSAELHGVALEDRASHTASTLEYRSVMGVLEEIFMRRWRKEHVTVVPLGSKMQAVGVALFSFLRPEVRVLSAEPARYESAEYSRGIGARWLLPLGESDGLRTRLRSVDSIRVNVSA
jgi:hypothetical protein